MIVCVGGGVVEIGVDVELLEWGGNSGGCS